MFDLGWGEMVLIGIVALIVVGPKELPGLFRTIGHAVGRARGMAREFSRAMEAAADESGVKEIDRTIRAAARPAQFGREQIKSAVMGPTTPPKAGTPLQPGAPVVPPTTAPALKPGGATEALAEKRAAERAALADRAPAAAPEPAPEPASTSEGQP
jgi:sec-independent protein translocase protein TatB